MRINHRLAKDDSVLMIKLAEREAASDKHADAQTHFGDGAQDATGILTHELRPKR
jgi:hypothetical protein